MAWPTVDDVGEYLDEVNFDDPVRRGTMENILARMQNKVEEALKPITYADYGAAQEKKVLSNWGQYLTIPAHQQGSVTLVKTTDGTDLVGYWRETDEGRLLAIDENGLLGDWGRAQYLVTAVWGYGPVPAVVQEMVIELAVNAWNERARGLFSQVSGADDSARIQYVGGLTRDMRDTIDGLKRNSTEVAI